MTVPDDCPTIQAALDAAANSGIAGTISVAPGTYRENIDFKGASVVLKGAKGPEKTTIDGSDAEASTVTFATGEGSGAVLEGFRISGGSGNPDENDSTRGGGIYIKEASPILRNLVVADNAISNDSGYGGGIHMSRSGAELEQVTVLDNRATYYGGGIHLSQSPNAELQNVEVIGNRATYGGGIALAYDGQTHRNLLVLDNEANFGAGLLIQSADPIVENATFHDNAGDAIHLLSGANPELANVTITGSTGRALNAEKGDADFFFCNVWGNDKGAVIGDDPPATGEGNLSQDPMYADPSGRRPENWDMTLADGSPLIDAGDPELEDPDGSRSDIGAYGGPGGGW